MENISLKLKKFKICDIIIFISRPVKMDNIRGEELMNFSSQIDEFPTSNMGGYGLELI